MQHDFDLVVVGSGAGALLGAIRAADLGLKPLVLEKTALVGGTPDSAPAPYPASVPMVESCTTVCANGNVSARVKP